jgi:hypothetical protein
MILYPCMCASIPRGAAGGGRVDLWWWLGLGFGVPRDGPLGIPVFCCHRRGGGDTRGLSGGGGGSSGQIAGMRRGKSPECGEGNGNGERRNRTSVAWLVAWLVGSACKWCKWMLCLTLAARGRAVYNEMFCDSLLSRSLYLSNNVKTRSNKRHNFYVENPCGKKLRAPIGDLHYDERVITHGIQWGLSLFRAAYKMYIYGGLNWLQSNTETNPLNT